MRPARMILAAGLMALLAPVRAEPAPASDAALFDGAGYRTARYRSPVAVDPAPARAIALADALGLHAKGAALFLDVMPAEGASRDPASGAWRLAEEHLTIPNALWFPETGRAPVDPVLWHALEARVRAERRAAPNRPVILFCRIDCWMSWNAARRLATAGFGEVFWLAEGTDGWHDAGRPLVVAVPVAVPAPAR